MDWHTLLNIANVASVDTETIKRQYKRMSLKVHPDKNSSIVAEGVFKHIPKAWSVLSQPTERHEYGIRSGAYAHARSTLFVPLLNLWRTKPSAGIVVSEAEASGSNFPTTTTSAATMAEIKPCPSCRKSVSHEEGNGFFSIECPHQNCGGRDQLLAIRQTQALPGL
ncbi:PREDICTED: uncharacterized protein LOC109114620 [Nelumbo nucifera]|uniref:Uncharacterized protein LOC109114620 n=1 Tax=Nelumbo nucifera TaxID=4432 RepID=A0A1U8Q2Q2_NELNU|nr:PREDICTED: uncharacterized protein LOC109114620 [Nelumbo nucifera]